MRCVTASRTIDSLRFRARPRSRWKWGTARRSYSGTIASWGHRTRRRNGSELCRRFDLQENGICFAPAHRGGLRDRSISFQIIEDERCLVAFARRRSELFRTRVARWNLSQQAAYAFQGRSPQYSACKSPKPKSSSTKEGVELARRVVTPGEYLLGRAEDVDFRMETGDGRGKIGDLLDRDEGLGRLATLFRRP